MKSLLGIEFMLCVLLVSLLLLTLKLLQVESVRDLELWQIFYVGAAEMSH